MQHSSTAFLIIALVIVVNQDGVTAQLVDHYDKFDQVAQEGKNRAVTIIDGPKLKPTQTAPPANSTFKSEQRPPSKPPIKPEKPVAQYHVELPRLYYSTQNLPPLRQHYNKPLKIQTPNSVFKYHKVIPLQPLMTSRPLIFSASTNKPSVLKSPKFNLPVETVNGIRTDFVRPPRLVNTTSTSTTTAATTTTRRLRTKRIWPKHILDKMNSWSSNSSHNANKTTSEDLNTSASHTRYIYKNRTELTTETSSTTRGPYRRVTRVPKKRYTTTSAPENYTRFAPNEWVPIIPQHYPINKVRVFKKTPVNRRSDSFFYYPDESTERRPDHKRTVYLQSFGLVPMESAPKPTANRRKHIKIIVGKKKVPKSSTYYRKRPIRTAHVIREHPFDQVEPKVRVKHHHHHHHHRYIKTVEKPVHVEVPKPVPVPVPMPIPIKVEQKVPYPVQVKVPHPVPVKVVEKEYVPQPYPVYQQVPVVKHVEVKVPQPYPVEKRVPYPVEVKVPVEKPYPVHIEKRIPYPVPVKVYVPQPYPVETKVPVTETVEVVKHVPVKVPYPQPYPVHVKVPVTVEKKVPYPVEVEKKVAVPVPFKVSVPEKVEVEKKVPVYVPKPYPVEKRVPVPVRVPYPVRVPIRVPFGIPILVHPSPQNNQVDGNAGDGETHHHHTHYSYAVQGDTVTNNQLTPVTEVPHSSVTVHGNGATSTQHSSVTDQSRPGFSFFGFQSRSDVVDETTTANSGTSTLESLTIDPQVSTAAFRSAITDVSHLFSDDNQAAINPR